MTHTKMRHNLLVPGFFNLMDKFMTEDFQTPVRQSRPAVNIIEGDQAYILQVMAPGLRKEDFKIAIEQDILTVSYEKTEQQEEKTEKFIRREFALNAFKRSFTLNEKLNADAITARYEQGILFLCIPKVEAKKVEVRSVEIN